MKKIVIIGATSAIAEHCARIWLQNEPTDLVLVGRDKTRIESIAVDLKIRSPKSKIDIIESDFLDPTKIQQTVNSISAQGDVDIALIAHGSLSDQRLCQENLVACRDAIEINAISPVLFAEAFAGNMEKAGHGTIAVIGSVAGDRGRKSIYVYGSAKALLERYVQGLQHRFGGTRIKAIIIKPGPTDTPMTAHLKEKGLKAAPVADVAADIVAGIEKGKAVIYTPKKWQLIMLIIQHIPGFIFNKLDI